jgi:hypothetical protein
MYTCNTCYHHFSVLLLRVFYLFDINYLVLFYKLLIYFNFKYMMPDTKKKMLHEYYSQKIQLKIVV